MTTIEAPELSDEQLMCGLADTSAPLRTDELFSELFRRYQSRVRNWCIRLTGDRDQSSDLAQEIFMKAYRHADSFRGDSRLSTWLYTITRNHCLNSLKKRTPEPIEITELLERQFPDEDILPADTVLERQQEFRLVWRLVTAALNPLEVRVVVLHYGYELPLAVITKQLSLSNPSGAKAYVVNARRKMHIALRHRGLKRAG